MSDKHENEIGLRIYLLRILIAWWMIPLTWIFVVPIGYLVFGWEDAEDAGRFLTKIYWWGGVK